MDFPSHWGNPPVHQSLDLQNLPGHYGRGSSTLRAWIMTNMEQDQHMNSYHLILRAPWEAWWLIHIGWFCFVLFTIFIKRKSLRPGGYLYNYDKEAIRKVKARRRRRLRDTLKDPVLVRHWEKKLEYTLGSKELAQTEMNKWRESVERWEQQGDDDFKDSRFYRKNGRVVMPSLNMIRLWMPVALWFVLVHPSSFAWMYVVLVGAHSADNCLIRRKYKSTKSCVSPSLQVPESNGDEVNAAVGIPAAKQVTII